MSGWSNSIAAEQLAALLGPGTAGACEDPRSPKATAAAGVHVVGRSGLDGCIAVSRQPDGPALSGRSNRIVADQLSLLNPGTITAGEDPRRARQRVVGVTTYDGCIAVRRKPDRAALGSASDCIYSYELASLLSPDTIAARKHPRRSSAPIVFTPANYGGVAVGGKSDRPTLFGRDDRASTYQLRPLLRELSLGELQ